MGHNYALCHNVVCRLALQTPTCKARCPNGDGLCEVAYSRPQQQDEPEREHDGEESEDDGTQSMTPGIASIMVLALGKAIQMDSESDSEEDDVDAPQ